MGSLTLRLICYTLTKNIESSRRIHAPYDAQEGTCWMNKEGKWLLVFAVYSQSKRNKVHLTSISLNVPCFNFFWPECIALRAGIFILYIWYADCSRSFRNGIGLETFFFILFQPYAELLKCEHSGTFGTRFELFYTLFTPCMEMRSGAYKHDFPFLMAVVTLCVSGRGHRIGAVFLCVCVCVCVRVSVCLWMIPRLNCITYDLDFSYDSWIP